MITRPPPAGLQLLAFQVHKYSNCLMRPYPNLTILPLPLTELPAVAAVPYRLAVGATDVEHHVHSCKVWQKLPLRLACCRRQRLFDQRLDEM